MIGMIHIKRHERGLLFRRGDFQRLLGPGSHWVPARLLMLEGTQVHVVSTLETLFRHPLLDLLVQEPALAGELHVLDLTSPQRALVWKDGRLAHVFGPGRYALWRTPFRLTVEVFDIGEPRLEHRALETILGHPEAGRWLDVIDIEPQQEALLFRDGRFIERLAQGRHVFWKGTGRPVARPVDLREQTVEVPGQEMVQTLYREAQLILRAAVGARTLDAILEDKESIGSEVQQVLQRRAAEFGVAVRGVGVRDIILPGEMKAILNRVIEAEKQAQANLIQRREETAAVRSMANTALSLSQ